LGCYWRLFAERVLILTNLKTKIAMIFLKLKMAIIMLKIRSKVWQERRLACSSRSGFKGLRRAYITMAILQRAWSANSKMVQQVFLRPLRPELEGQDAKT
jgi:hypothetical protein